MSYSLLNSGGPARNVEVATASQEEAAEENILHKATLEEGNWVSRLLLGILWVLTLPLVFIEIIILWKLEWKLPPLSCFLNRNPFSGVFDTFDRSTLPAQPDVPSEFEDEIIKVELNVDSKTNSGDTFYKFDAAGPGGAAAMVEKSCHIMLATTTVSTTHDIPNDMQGIFWMDGNGLPEVIVSMNYGVWDPERLVLTKVTAKFDWSYLDTPNGMTLAGSQTPNPPSGMMPTTFSSSDLDCGRIWICYGDEYSHLSWMSLIGEFTIERLPQGACPESVDFKRGIYWFPAIFGRRLEVGSYTLRKIMHTDRTKVQPAYNDFVKWMATTNKCQSLLMPAFNSKEDAVE